MVKISSYYYYKEAQHVASDELRFGEQDKNPDANLLARLHSGESVDTVFETVIDITDINIQLDPFLQTTTFEAQFHHCEILGCAFVYDISCAPINTTLTVKSFLKANSYSYVVSIDEQRIYNAADVQAVLSALAEDLISSINGFATTESKGTGELIDGKGLHSVFNGVDVYQTRDYIKLSCETYLDRLLATYGPIPK